MKTFLTIAFSLTLPLVAAAQTAAVFDWRVPARYTVDGMIGVRLPVARTAATLRVLNPEGSFGDAAPAGWPADFDACSPQAGPARYTWSVDGRKVVESTNCQTRIMFPREGRYRVELTVEGDQGRATSAQDVNIQDWLIIGLGDSYGSGEGVPNVPARMDDGKFEAAHEAWRVASTNYQEAVAKVAAAQADVDKARADLAAARKDLDEVAAAMMALEKAKQAASEAQDAVEAATAAVVRASAGTAAAAAKVGVECAKLWAPSRCTAAKANLAQARHAESVAIAARARAVKARNAALASLAEKTAAVPAAGFEYLRGVVEARVALMQSRVDVATTVLESAKQFAASSNEILEAAVLTMYQNAGETAALWQDSRPVAGRIIVEGDPSYEYEPHMYSQCHQSKFSGQALAALKLEEDDPKTSVTFIHLACSGGTIPEGIVGEYEGIEPPRPWGGNGKRPAQIDEAASLAAGREVDAFVMSVGGNDIGFGDTITNCITTEPCFATNAQVMSDDDIARLCDSIVPGERLLGRVAGDLCRASLKKAAEKFVGSDAHTTFMANLAKLPEKYAQVEARLRTHWPLLPQNRMFLTQYPMVTRDSHNEVCGAYADPANNLPGLSAPEQLWAEQVAGALLNATIEGQELALGWSVVKGIDEAFRLHGYCSDKSWIVRIGESLRQQVGMTGTAHPNPMGHAAYAEQISASLRKAFYPQSTSGVLGPARVAAR
jgi:hypothetical protein